MSDIIIPERTTTAVAATVTEQPTTSRIHFDLGYLKTAPGILQVVQILVSTAAFICAILAHGADRPETILPFRPGHAAWAAFVSFLAILLTSAWLAVHLLHVDELAPRLPWPIFELAYYAIWAFFFISGAVLAALSSDADPAFVHYHQSDYPYDYKEKVRNAAAAGSFFAFAATALFVVSVVLLLRAWRNQRTREQFQPMQRAQDAALEVGRP